LILLKAFFVARVFACSREVSLESFLCLEWSVADGKGEQMEKVSADGKGVSRWKRCQQMEKVSADGKGVRTRSESRPKTSPDTFLSFMQEGNAVNDFLNRVAVAAGSCGCKPADQNNNQP
jgi:hypothetical protein